MTFTLAYRNNAATITPGVSVNVSWLSSLIIFFNSAVIIEGNLH